MQILLQTWPELEPEQALELLDYTYAEREVRKFAVRCLEKMRWGISAQKLIQMVVRACVRVLKVGSTWDIRTKEGAISQGRGIFVAHLRYQNKKDWEPI